MSIRSGLHRPREQSYKVEEEGGERKRKGRGERGERRKGERGEVIDWKEREEDKRES